MNLNAEDCLRILKEIAQNNPDKTISRDFLRQNGEIPETQWSKHFGNFNEFKRQAGLQPTRSEVQLQNQIAKHADADKYRKLSEERKEWAGKYLKPVDKRWQTMMVCSDLHDKNCDPFWEQVFLDTAKRIQPEIICINGDIFDLLEFSRFTVDPRDFDMVGSFKWVHGFLEKLRKTCPNAQIDIISGNHEDRMMKYLTDQAVAVKSLLGDVYGWNMEDLFGLKKYHVNFVGNSDLSAFSKSDMNTENRRNWKLYHETFLCHHYPDGINFGVSGTNGHHHKFESRTFFSAIYGTCVWTQTGCGHKRSASYCDGERWGQGFLIAHLDIVNKKVAQEYVDTTNGFAMVGGKFYQK